MSVEDFKKFGQMCTENEDVRKKAKKIIMENHEGLIPYGKELGFDFTADDIKTLEEEAGVTDQELSEEQLEKVAGGFVTTTAAVVAGGIGSAAGGAATVATAAGAW
jgi:predicted ribosomally synthesized peptide with nif11-like leader